MTTDLIVPWVESATDPRSRELRQAVHTVLVAISRAPRLPKTYVMKGGILLALQYGGDRFTRDIDFSTALTTAELSVESVREELDQSLSAAVEQLNYGLDCRIQACELRPPGPEASWPTLTMTVGYAPKLDSRRHRRLMSGQATEIISLDFSYNEVITAIDFVDIPGGAQLRAASLADLVAEKYRAMIQQPVRRRTRRQDAYDLYRLLDRPALQTKLMRREILVALREKSASRQLLVDRASIRNPDVIARSEAEYHLLRGEITSELPEFKHAYAAVRDYYESLPWS
jgi:predicted nucleotidyltransferase component of viral defense system